MKKLRLDIDTLQVDSFSTLHERQVLRGTVHGQETHVSPCVPTAYTRCWGLCGGASEGTFCGGGDFTHVCDTEYTNCGGHSCAGSCDSCHTSCNHTVCRETCVEHVCMATEYPYCEA